MIWRRVQVPASLTLRELHGIIQVVMGWEGIHLFQFMLRARRFGSLELAARSPDGIVNLTPGRHSCRRCCPPQASPDQPTRAVPVASRQEMKAQSRATRYSLAERR
ncbi:plasmid pRiA4b ORF-3 family protein [Microvirga ossetica]|uniref:plasmid pRiA4b ORF-3 family protein n=1 Tax=Microvirga ossetica TaxID=1882682 RepID=UPI001F2348AC|nr:plasmid pRiA4b ORF-3 family protein [Microvirga ossetica]